MASDITKRKYLKVGDGSTERGHHFFCGTLNNEFFVRWIKYCSEEGKARSTESLQIRWGMKCDFFCDLPLQVLLSAPS